MEPNWRMAEGALSKIRVEGNARNEEVSLSGYAEDLYCVGLGTDAAVFIYEPVPEVAYKIYTDQALHKKERERDVYLRLRGIPYFPVYYGEGRNYLAIGYEPGPTLLDCLLQGIPVPPEVISDVEEARRLARERGLNPRDIHLKNVVVQDGRAKVIDVSEYAIEGDDRRWEHLMWAYQTFYPSLEGKKIPLWLLNSVKSGYQKLDQANLNLEEYAQRISGIFSRFMR